MLKAGFSNNIFDLSIITDLLCFLWKGVVLEKRPQINKVLMIEIFLNLGPLKLDQVNLGSINLRPINPSSINPG